jgi:hypothetical protein
MKEEIQKHKNIIAISFNMIAPNKKIPQLRGISTMDCRDYINQILAP